MGAGSPKLNRAVFLFLQRNQDFAVSARYGGNVSLSNAGPTVGNSDVIDQRIDLIGGDYLPDSTFDRREPKLGLLNAGPCRRARMKPHLAGIHIGEEILADQPDKAQRSNGHKHERGKDAAAMA